MKASYHAKGILATVNRYDNEQSTIRFVDKLIPLLDNASKYSISLY